MDRSRFEGHSFVAGTLLLAAGIALAIYHADLGGSAWVVGTLGLAAIGLCAGSRGVRLYRANVTAALPSAVGRVGVRVRPRRTSTAITALLALVLPAAMAVALVALVEWGWLAIAAVAALGYLGLLVGAERGRPELDYEWPFTGPSALLERLCMRADIPVPELVVEPGPPNAWTTRGCIHVTMRLLKLLDQSELEAVLAHELAHLARRDAAVMDVCSAPSRILLRYAGFVGSGIRAGVGALRHGIVVPGFGLAALFATLTIPPAFLLGWVSRLSVLHMSRTREFAADAAAAALTGRPSALASALLKLDDGRAWVPRADLRTADAHAVLCIVGRDSSRLGPVFCSHPKTAARVKRLQALEQRVQAGGRAIRFDDEPR